MKAEIIASGSELVRGARLNTNAQWLAQKLLPLGIEAFWHTTIGDALDHNISALQIAVERADVIFMTGGLGPTQDDLTREAFAALIQQPLEFDAGSFAVIEAMFQARGTAMPERNRVQAFFPRGTTPLPNPVGSAPGIWTEFKGKIIIAMPGVPREMHRMFADQVLPRLRQLPGLEGAIEELQINCMGLGESAVEEKIFDLTKRDHVPEVGITASEGMISLRIIGRGKNAAAAKAQIVPVQKTIEDRLGPFIFSVGSVGADLASVVCKELAARKLSCAIGDAAMGGILAQRLMKAADAADGPVTIKAVAANSPAAFSDLITTHQNEAKAAAVAEKCDCDVGVFFFGERASGDAHGTEYWTISSYISAPMLSKTTAREKTWTVVGSRADMQNRVVTSVLNELRLFLAEVNSL